MIKRISRMFDEVNNRWGAVRFGPFRKSMAIRRRNERTGRGEKVLMWRTWWK